MDTRVKVITDVVNGVRTIKCYNWEEAFYQRVVDVRKKQHTKYLLIGAIMALGFSVFQNGGLIIAVVIFTTQWGIGETFTEA